MVKYLKKLLYTTVFFGAMLGISMLVTLIVQDMTFLTEDAKFAVSVAPAVVIMVGAAFYIRLQNKKLKDEYLSDRNKDEDYVVLGKVFKSKENLLHTLAFATLAVALFVAIGASGTTPFGFLVLGSMMLAGICTVIFYIFNSVIWYIVHARWIKEVVALEKERNDAKKAAKHKK